MVTNYTKIDLKCGRHDLLKKSPRRATIIVLTIIDYQMAISTEQRIKYEINKLWET